jgi:hypothetical protein
MKPLVLPTLLLLALAPSAQFRMVHLGTVDVDKASTGGDPSFIASSPSAVAWDGTNLWLGGFNNKAVPDAVGLVKIENALTTPVFSPAFGVQLGTPAFRGFSGLDYDAAGQRVYAAFDEGSTDGNALGISAWDATVTPTSITPSLWTKFARGSSGVGLDPGSPGGTSQGQGTGWTSFGKSSRALQDATTGADVWTLTDGMSIVTSEGTFWRDMDFRDSTGDIWLREGNNVIQGVRSGDNALSALNVVVDVADADFVAGQNLAYVDRGGNDFVIYNDRSKNDLGQDWFVVMKAVLPDGSPAVVDWLGLSVPTGNGWYDFSWDPASDTLAILDFANRKVQVFSVQDIPPLDAAPPTLSLASGGAQTWNLAAGASVGGSPYLVLGSQSGTSPGVPADGWVLPLNIDGYFLYTLTNPNSQALVNTFGTLAPDGSAQASLVLPPGLSPSFAGQVFHHAFATFDITGSTPLVSFTSNAASLTLNP